MRVVHYFCRKPGVSGELVYPDELPKDYQTLGAFFLGGSRLAGVENAYLFHAVRDGAVESLELRRTGELNLSAHAEGIGDFGFKAIRSRLPARYTGNHPYSDTELVWQLASRDRSALEDVANEKGFFFVGYSPRIETTEPPRAPEIPG